MSTLTKVLIVLVTLASTFLCGTVVTYVSTADNYKLKFEEQNANNQALTTKNATLVRQMSEQMAATQRLVDELNQKLQAAQLEKNNLQLELSNINRTRAELEEKLVGYTAVIKGFNQTISDMDQSLRLARSELDKVRSEQISNRRNLNEVTESLDERTVQLESLESERRRLLEEKVALESELADISGGAVKATGVRGPVTEVKDKAREALPATEEISLQGVITNVDMKNSLATISIGSADGVRRGQRFHVTRGDRFICDIAVSDVEPEQAAGVLDLVQEQPKSGDNVSTSW